MRNLWKVGALSAVFGAVLGMGGCQDFDAAYEECQDAGRCDVKDGGGGGDGGSDAGDAGDAGYDCVPSSGPDFPDELGKDTDCDGVDGDPALGFFVDPLSGSDDVGTQGTRDAPLKTVSRALQLVGQSDGGKSLVYLATGTYSEPTPLEVTVPVSLHGGYEHSGTNWLRPKSEASSVLVGAPYAVTVRNVIKGPVLFDRIHIRSTTLGTSGAPSVALRAVNVQELRLRDSIVEAGRGANGTDGPAGDAGVAGGQGFPGDDGTLTNSPEGGDGGIASCEGAFEGGRGGGGGILNSGGLGATGTPDVDGGTGGTRGAVGTVDACVNNRCNCEAGDGGTGSRGPDGHEGTPGMDGGAGPGLMRPEAVWQDQQTGASGRNGGNGGGGG
ncbi:DUF1565 domain-containing protein, partial [Corallococcus sp. AB049A]|uniref:DUF1565 domain-containing protein n=2 Tax=Corallococcus TaxID=83461 RepID=UPI000EBF9160